MAAIPVRQQVGRMHEYSLSGLAENECAIPLPVIPSAHRSGARYWVADRCRLCDAISLAEDLQAGHCLLAASFTVCDSEEYLAALPKNNGSKQTPPQTNSHHSAMLPLFQMFSKQMGPEFDTTKSASMLRSVSLLRNSLRVTARCRNPSVVRWSAS